VGSSGFSYIPVCPVPREIANCSARPAVPSILLRSRTCCPYDAYSYPHVRSHRFAPPCPVPGCSAYATSRPPVKGVFRSGGREGSRDRSPMAMTSGHTLGSPGIPGRTWKHPSDAARATNGTGPQARWSESRSSGPDSSGPRAAEGRAGPPIRMLSPMVWETDRAGRPLHVKTEWNRVYAHRLRERRCREYNCGEPLPGSTGQGVGSALEGGG